MFISIKHHNKAQTYITMSNPIDEKKAKAREYNKAYNAANKDKIKETNKKYKAEHRDIVNECKTRYREKNREKLREIGRQYRAKKKNEEEVAKEHEEIICEFLANIVSQGASQPGRQ